MKSDNHIDIDGFNLKYKCEGNGDKTALIIGSAIYYPRTFSENLRKHLKLIFVDHRGFVPGKMNISELTINLLTDDIEKIRKHLNLDKFIIMGHSGHGYMALGYAKKYPQNVSHVVLIAMGPDQSAKSHEAANEYLQNSACPERKSVLQENIAKLPEELEKYPNKRFITFCLRLGARGWYNFNFDATPFWKDVYVNMPIIDHVWGVLFRDIDITKNLENFNVPVFLALGKFDYLVAPFYTWEPIRNKFRNLTIKLFKKSSHMPQLEESEWFDNELLEWLNKKEVYYENEYI